MDVAPGNGGTVWILDTNRRLQEFSRSGTYIRGIQLDPCTAGITPDPLTRGGLDVTNGSAYVAHPCRDVVERHRLSDLATTNDAAVTRPKGVNVQLYDTAPANTRHVYVARPGAGQVVRLDRDHLAVQNTITVPGSPSDVFVDAFGVMFVSDTTNNVIRLYGSDDQLFRTLGGTGSDAGKLNNPVAFDVFEQFSDLAGNIFIADYGNNRLQRWNSFGFTFWTAVANGSGGGVLSPVNSTAPAISGSPVVGNQLTCSQGTWSNSPTSYAYRWVRNGTDIPGATSNTYTVQAADFNVSLTCRVTATNAAGSASATSQPVFPTNAAAAPQNTSAPVIGGEAREGRTLTCSQGTWNNSPTGFSYVWRRNGVAIGGATSNSYVVVAADVGTAITCTVTATNSGGNGSATSDPVQPSNGSTTGPVGVSINAGTTFVNSPGVSLTIHEPAGATGILISNDGGFANATPRAIVGDDRHTWTLASSGPERLPKTVYVRFTGGGVDDTKTFTDDIILDQRPPNIVAASTSQGGVRIAGGTVLKVRAKDGVSGVDRLQIARKRTGKYSDRKFASRTVVKNAKAARFVRVVDGAGNFSSWKRVK